MNMTSNAITERMDSFRPFAGFVGNIEFVPALMIAVSTILWIFWFVSDRRKTFRGAGAMILVYSLLHLRTVWEYLELATSFHPHTCAIVTLLATIAFIGPLWAVKEQELHQTNLVTKEQDFLRPLIFPCRTTHTRLFPTKHSFSYSYLYVGIPVGWNGPVGTILSADRGLSRSLPYNTPSTWFDVVCDDYLQRGKHEGGLRGKLQDYLATQNIVPDRFPHALLVTAPRFFGFSFNPVSFWYLYDQSLSLGAMILEVNNTFDERRMYFMERTTSTSQIQGYDTKFVQEWPKDFHVSPFNDRGGFYSVQSINPFHLSRDGLHRIDNNIVLKSPEGNPKIIARVYSSEPALDAATISRWQSLSFVFRWWWVGFMTNPRIIREARILWAKNLQVYYRPEVLSSSIGRNETPQETEIEPYFQLLLQQMADRSGVQLLYIPAAGSSRARPIKLQPNTASGACLEIEVRILTPEFYNRLVACESLLETFDRHCFCATEGEVMAKISQPEALRSALNDHPVSPEGNSPSGLKWRMVSFMRKKPSLAEVFCATAKVFRVPAVRLSRREAKLSELDLVVLQNGSKDSINDYQWTTLTVLLADRIAFGSIFILRIWETCVWLMLLYAAASEHRHLLKLRHSGDLLVWRVLKLFGVHLWMLLIPRI